MSKLQIIVAAVAAALFAGAPAFAQTADTAKAKTKTATMPQEKGDPESPKADSIAKKPGAAKKVRAKTAQTPQAKEGDPESPKSESIAKKSGPKKPRVKTTQTPQEKGDPEHPQGTMKK